MVVLLLIIIPNNYQDRGCYKFYHFISIILYPRYDTEKLWADIQRMVVKTIIAISPELKVEYRGEVPQGKPGPNPFQVMLSMKADTGTEFYIYTIHANFSKLFSNVIR